MSTRPSNDPLSHLLARQEVVILDGGLGTELEHRGHDLSDPLWSARLLADQPEAVLAVHRAYLQAGADVIITASYQATFEGFAARGLEAEVTARLLRRSVELASQACDEAVAHGLPPGRQAPQVAASVGPYGAFLADGSEYRGGYGLSVDELAAFHRPRVAALAEAGAALLACETLPCPEEAQALLGVLAEHPALRAWVSFSCRDERRVGQGEPFADCVALAAASPQIVAVGVNCTAPRHIAGLLRRAAAVTALPLVAYPNRAEIWDAAARRWRPDPAALTAPPAVAPTATPTEGDLAPTDLAALASQWRAAGARLLGGCCRTRPQDIQRLRQALGAAATPRRTPS
jgi:homocysteine S-methyltransferase